MRTWQVSDVMTRDVVTVSEGTPYREIVEALAEHRVSALPVVDDDRRVVGVVSEADLLHRVEHPQGRVRWWLLSGRRRRARAKARATLAKDLMSAPAVTVAPDASLTEAARLMDEQRLKRLPVTDRSGRIQGIVTRSDVLRVFLRPDDAIERDVREEVLHRTLWVEPGAVEVRVSGGVVTLTGRTDRWSTAHLAVSLTRSVPGVIDVVDQLGYELDDRQLARAPVGSYPFGVP